MGRPSGKGTAMPNVHRKSYRDFLERVKQARAQAGLTQTDVAKKLGKPQSYVSKFESGERRLDYIEVRELAVIYKVSMTYFDEAPASAPPSKASRRRAKRPGPSQAS